MKKVEPIYVELQRQEKKIKKKLRVICAADTHGLFSKMIKTSSIPDGDIFIHAGDFSLIGSKLEIEEFNSSLKQLPHKHKIVICGNRDKLDHLTMEEIQNLLPNCIYLQDTSVNIEGVKIHGSPWEFLYEGAFFCKDPKIYWSKIPQDVDILVTHIPPHNILDLARDFNVERTNKECNICKKSHNGFSHW